MMKTGRIGIIEAMTGGWGTPPHHGGKPALSLPDGVSAGGITTPLFLMWRPGGPSHPLRHERPGSQEDGLPWHECSGSEYDGPSD